VRQGSGTWNGQEGIRENGEGRDLSLMQDRNMWDDHFASKNSEEKDKTFGTLLRVLPGFNQQVCSYRSQRKGFVINRSTEKKEEKKEGKTKSNISRKGDFGSQTGGGQLPTSSSYREDGHKNCCSSKTTFWNRRLDQGKGRGGWGKRG